MAIRFQCGSCSQPIEIDDEWASKAVACPYCRKTVTAPMESTLDDPAQVPTASPLAGGMAEPNVGMYPGVDSAPPAASGMGPRLEAVSNGASPNRIAVVAIILACCTLGLHVLSGMIAAAHPDAMAELTEGIQNAQNFAEQLEVQNEIFSEWGGPPGWLLGIILCTVFGGLLWIATVVCGIIGVRRARRRKLAVAALMISGTVLVLSCCGGLPVGG